jgi:hypothetical protein
MEAMGHGYLEPDIVLPSHFLPRTIAMPEKRLLLAVLEEAVGTLRRYLGATDRYSRATFADVEAWFASEDSARLCSFVGICDALEIDATHLRSGLRRWLSLHGAPSIDTADPIYRFPYRRGHGRRHRAIGQRQSLPTRA